MSTVLVTYPETLVIDAETMKQHLRVDGNDEDTYIEELINAATRYAEGYTRRQFVNATYRKTLDCWNCKIYLDFPPLVSVQSVESLIDDEWTTWDSSNYRVITDAHVGYVYSTSTPDHDTGPAVFRIDYTAGFGETAATVPDEAVQAIRLIVGHWFLNREAVVLGTIATSVPMAANALLDQIAVREFA